MTERKLVRRLGVGIALLSGIAALALLMLPLLLVLLMTLFDTVAGSLLVLLGLLITWIRDLLPPTGSGLPAYQLMTLDPLHVAVHSLLPSLPCLAGLMLIVLDRRTMARWRGVVLLWAVTAWIGGQMATILLLPGLVVAAVFSLP